MIDLYGDFRRELAAPAEQPPPWPTTTAGWIACLSHPVIGLLQAGGYVWLAYLAIKYGFLLTVLLLCLPSLIFD